MDDDEFIIRTKQGRITGHMNEDGTWYVGEFVVFKKYRKQGFGKRLATLFPPACDLIASPLDTSPECLDQEALVCLYQRFGFVFDQSNGKRNWARTRVRGPKSRPRKKDQPKRYDLYGQIQGL